MSIKIKQSHETLGELANRFPRSLRKAFRQRVEDEVIPHVQDVLIKRLVEETPSPRGSGKFVWSRKSAANERARRWWFANVNSGEIDTDGSHYRRTGKMQKQWRVYGKVRTNSAELEVINRNPGAKYVYGNAERPQIPGHRDTGWPSINRLLAGASRRIDNRVGKIFDDMADEIIKG